MDPAIRSKPIAPYAAYLVLPYAWRQSARLVHLPHPYTAGHTSRNTNLARLFAAVGSGQYERRHMRLLDRLRAIRSKTPATADIPGFAWLYVVCPLRFQQHNTTDFLLAAILAAALVAAVAVLAVAVLAVAVLAVAAGSAHLANYLGRIAAEVADLVVRMAFLRRTQVYWTATIPFRLDWPDTQRPALGRLPMPASPYRQRWL